MSGQRNACRRLGPARFSTWRLCPPPPRAAPATQPHRSARRTSSLRHEAIGRKDDRGKKKARGARRKTQSQHSAQRLASHTADRPAGVQGEAGAGYATLRACRARRQEQRVPARRSRGLPGAPTQGRGPHQTAARGGSAGGSGSTQKTKEERLVGRRCAASSSQRARTSGASLRHALVTPCAQTRKGAQQDEGRSLSAQRAEGNRTKKRGGPTKERTDRPTGQAAGNATHEKADEGKSGHRSATAREAHSAGHRRQPPTLRVTDSARGCAK
ncbi:hypothetical protein ERJ75_000623800 [Trypanosoma vivax]|nr:hypothetical protein ERJ75_000623800 [Trypanosoma vivax]